MDDIKLMVMAVRDYVGRCMAPFAERLKTIEDRFASGELKGEPGAKGADGTPGERGADGINGKDGAPGKDGAKGEPGAKGDTGEHGEMGLKGDAGERGEKGDTGEKGEKGDRGEPGEPGKPGKDGADGQPGRDGKDGAPGFEGKSITVDDVRPLISEVFSKALPDLTAKVDEFLAAIPAPQNGKDGEPGKSVTVEDLLPALEVAIGKWALDFERRAADVLQRAIDKMPKPKDGRDAFELEDLSVEHDGDGSVTLKFTRGDVVKEFPLRLPRFKDKGGFRPDAEYREGDGVSFGGSLFLAQKDAPIGKPGESEDWRLAVKRGRDGKDGVLKTEPGPRGPVKLS